MKAIKTILNYAYLSEVVDRKISDGIGNVKLDKKSIDIFTFDELNKLFFSDINCFFNQQAKLACMIAAFAGLRRGEILALQLQDIDFKAKIIKVVRKLPPDAYRYPPVIFNLRNLDF